LVILINTKLILKYMIKRTIASKFNTQGAVRVNVPESKTSGFNGGKISVPISCSAEDDPYVTYAYDSGWSVRLQRNVHTPVFECGYVE